MPRVGKKSSSKKSSKRASRKPRRSYSRSAYSKPYVSRANENNYGRMVGNGDYSYFKPGPWGKAGRAVGGALAKTFGFSSRGGQQLGGLAHYIGKIFGSGDYRTAEPPQVNSLFEGSSTIPEDISFGEKSIRFRHKEYLSDIISSNTAGAFFNQSYPINPGLASSFPFLAALAENFQTYKLHGLIYEFKSLSANALNSTNTALGSVVMVVDYNSASGPFTSKQDMLNSMGAIDCKPSECAIMGVECDPRRIPVNELYVRTGAVPAGQDSRLYDMGVLNIATVGMQAASVNNGELYVIYDIELMLPVLQNLGFSDQTFIGVLNTSVVSTANILGNYQPYPNLPSYTITNSSFDAFQDTLGPVIYTSGGASDSYIFFPPTSAGGIYTIFIQYTGASTAGAAWGTVTLGGGLVQTSGVYTLPATQSVIMLKYTVQVPQLGANNWGSSYFTGWPSFKIAHSTSTLPGTLVSACVNISRINPALLNNNALTITYVNEW